MATLSLVEQTLKIVGKVDYSNADQIYKLGYQQLRDVTVWPLRIDLSEVQQGNTLLLAIIIQWLRKTQPNAKIQLVNVPEKMLGIIKASHLESLLSN